MLSLVFMFLTLLSWQLCIWCYFLACFVFKISYIISAKAFAVFTWELDVAKLSV